MIYEPTVDKINKSGLTFSLVIETENLGMAGLEDLEKTIASLEAQSYPVHNAKEILIIVGSHISKDTLNFLQTKYPWLQIHVENRELTYVEAKMRGAELATSDIVIFADSDVVYNSEWLANMLYTFVWSPGATIVSGETRIDVTSIYRMAIQLTWMLNVNSDFLYPKPHRNFYLNNFAIKRSAMLAVPFVTGLPLYRSMIGEWIKKLRYHGYAIMRAPHAHGFHAPPGNPWDYWYRMLIFGADEVSKGDFYFSPDGSVMEKFSPVRRLYGALYFMALKGYRIISRTYFLLKEDISSIFFIVLSIPIVLASLVVNFTGSIIALFNRDYLFKKISAREDEHVV